MNFISLDNVARKWKVPEFKVELLCSHGLIEEAKISDNTWLVPASFKKPLDLLKPLKPFVKWAGGKGQLLKTIKSNYPSSLGKDIKKYAEPFVGGGAILFDILSTYNLDAIFISDINKELITTYKTIRDDIKGLVDLLCRYEEEYIPLNSEDRKIYFYEKRKQYNELKKDDNNDLKIASLFIFLNRTCFNGLYRVNSRGEFNVPMGSYKNPRICDKDNLNNISIAIKNVEIVEGDYKTSYEFIDENTFVYFDPPYRPLNSTSHFTSYSENGFNDEAQKELARYVDILNEKGAMFMLSNSDPKNSDENDNFFDDLYKKYEIKRIEAVRMINSKVEGRGKIKEILVRNYEN